MQLISILGIIICLIQAGIFSGLNLAFFNVSRLRLHIEAEQKNKKAIRILSFRKDSNLLLSTILWGNVAVNVILTLISGSILAGIFAFLFSTIVITLFGEIIPQAYFSRHALNIAYFFSPLIRFYHFILYPVAKPTALALDYLVGSEAIQYFQEDDLEELIRMHIRVKDSEIDRVEGRGALNFLAIDDIPVAKEGQILDPRSIISLKFENEIPIFPKKEGVISENFLKEIQASRKKWIVITDDEGEPRLVLNSNTLFREALFNKKELSPLNHCYKPLLIKDPKTPIGEILKLIQVYNLSPEYPSVKEKVVIIWGKKKKIITGSDILDKLLEGIVQT
ncbi:MAG: DUF21 domain-containing protein [Thermodesulfobacteriota bacterium]